MEFGRIPQAAVILVVAVAIVVYAYMRLRASVTRRDRWVLMGLRIAALAVLAFCITEPTGVVTRVLPIRSQVGLLVDRSASMSIEDVAGPDGPETRWSTALRAASSLGATLSNDFDVRHYTFDADLQGVADGEYGIPDGVATDVLNAVNMAIDRTRGAPLAGVIVLTDGAQNVGTLSLAESYDAPVFTLAVGDPKVPKDVAVIHVSSDPYLFVGERATIHATVRTSGYPTRPLTLSLSDHRRVLAADTWDTGDQSQHEIELSFTPESEGTYRCRVGVSPLLDELTDANNERAVTVQVLPARTRVLLVDATPRHEFAFLRRTLERLDSVEVTPVLLAMPTVARAPDSVASQSGRYPLGNSVSVLPSTDRDYGLYDVALIGDVPLAMLTAAQREWLVAFVQDHGKGVGWLAGENWLSRRMGVGALEELLPVTVPPSGGRVLSTEFAPVVSQEGQFHAVTHLGASSVENDLMWTRMPLWNRLYSGLTVRADATVLVTAGPGGPPVVAYRRVGLGKSLLIATDSTWRWGFGSAIFGETDAQHEAYSRFWSQTVRWLATPLDAKQVTIALGNSQPQTGETLEARIRVYDAGMSPASDASVQVTMRYPDGHAAPVPVIAPSNASGSFQAYVALTQAGMHELTASATVRGVSMESDPVAFEVASPQLEFTHVARDDVFLSALADVSGGTFAGVEDALDVVGMLTPGTETRQVRERRALWSHPLVFVAIVVLLTVEWAQRKRKGLV